MSEPMDRRAAERIPVTAGTACAFVAPVVEGFGSGRLRDISMNGVGLVVSRKVEVGTLLTLTLANEAKGFAKTVLVRVAHATAVPGGFLLGGEFTTPLTYQDLTTLVL